MQSQTVLDELLNEWLPDVGVTSSSAMPDDSRTRRELHLIELRCGGTMHGKLDISDGKLEVKCGRRGCGAGRGVVVLHTFSLVTGEMVGTKQYADPAYREENHDPR